MGDHHEHCHEHDHGEDAQHPHTHTHANAKAQSPEETIAMLRYMIDHNRHHGEDMHEIFHALADSGKTEAAELVHQAMHLSEDANGKLEDAMKKLGGE